MEKIFLIILTASIASITTLIVSNNMATVINPTSTIAPSLIITVTPSPTSVPTPTQIVKKQSPSTRSLRVAGYFYLLYKNVEDRDRIRQKYGIPKSNDNAEIIQFAERLDKNQGDLAMLEAAIDRYNNQQGSVVNLPPPVMQEKSPPLNCTSNTIGDYTYTNCY